MYFIEKKLKIVICFPFNIFPNGQFDYGPTRVNLKIGGDSCTWLILLYGLLTVAKLFRFAQVLFLYLWVDKKYEKNYNNQITTN